MIRSSPMAKYLKKQTEWILSQRVKNLILLKLVMQTNYSRRTSDKDKVLLGLWTWDTSDANRFCSEKVGSME